MTCHSNIYPAPAAVGALSFINMEFKLKKVAIPKDKAIEELDVVETWTVKWYSRHGEFYSNITPTSKTFLTREDADKFKTSLLNALDLLEYTCKEARKIELFKTK